MMILLLSIAAAISGLLAIWFACRQVWGGFYFCKPLTTLLILLIPLLGEGEIQLYGGLILGGLGLSLLGDIFLMLPENRFLAGWGAFLAAHLLYITAFTSGLSELRWEPALPIFGLASAALIYLFPHLSRFKLPVTLYVGVISLMAWTAWSRWLGDAAAGFPLAASGAALFMISDWILALDRFKGKFKSARALNLLTYYAAQMLIALSAVKPG